MWGSGLRTWHCHCSGSGLCCGTGSTPGPETSMCLSAAPKKEKRKERKENLSQQNKIKPRRSAVAQQVKDLALFLLWLGVPAVGRVRSLARELVHATGRAEKKFFLNQAQNVSPGQKKWMLKTSRLEAISRSATVRNFVGKPHSPSFCFWPPVPLP